MTARPIVIGALLAAMALSGSAMADLGADEEIIVRVGDRVRVEDEPLGCRIAHRGGEVVVDCRRAGRLAGTYGVFMGRRTVKVARYRSDSVAKIVFTARHHGSSRTCHDGSATPAGND